MTRGIGESSILRGMVGVVLLESVAVVAVSVMACGMIEYTAVLVAGSRHTYDSIFMLGMIGPTAVGMTLISHLTLRASRRLMIRPSLRGAAGARGAKKRKDLVHLETAAVVVVSVVTFDFLDYASYRRAGGGRPYDVVVLIAMSAAMALVMWLIAGMSLRAMHGAIARLIVEARRQRAAKCGVREVAIETGKEASTTVQRLRRWRLGESLVIVIAAVMSFGLVEFFANVVIGHNPHYQPTDMIGMIGPIAIIMGLVSFRSLRTLTRTASQLMGAIGIVAKGRFDVRLREEEAGPYREVFTNFNTMCEELRVVQTLRDDFINHFSHEFKTPITSINGFANLLLEEGLSAEERRRFLKIIASESDRLAGMSNNALMMTRLNSQHFILETEPYALDEQIKRCAILLSPQWESKHIDLSADLEPATYTGNADLMQHVWINLLGNAIKYTPSGGKVSISLATEERFFSVDISDTGMGIPEDLLSRIFEKYYQAGSSGGTTGLGLGLPIAKHIVDLAGGQIHVQSAVGEGTTFAVRLPNGPSDVKSR